MNLRHVFLGAALLGLGCNYQSTSECECEAPPPEAAAICDPAGPLETELHFQTSPGGVTEVDHHFVAEHGCKVRLVDVREPEEVAAGIVAGSEAIPLDRVLEAASEWNPQDPVVFVCRSGRRSGRAVGLLQRMGFLRAASLTGGVLTWTAAGLPLAEGPALPRLEAEPAHVAPAGPDGPITAAELQASLSEISIPHVRAAGLLLQSSASCVDGRDESAVMGTPGGDAGELLLALATIEQLTGETLDAVTDARAPSFASALGHVILRG